MFIKGKHTYWRKPLAMLLILSLVISSFSAIVGPSKTEAAPLEMEIKLNQPGDKEYKQNDGDVLLAPNATVNGSALYADGSLTYAIQGGSTANENISLKTVVTPSFTDGVVSVVGSKIYLGKDGTSAKQIGSVNSSLNGLGKNLKLDFSSPLPNGDFSNGTTGWSINNRVVDLTGEGLATKTKGAALVSVTGSGPYTVTGTTYIGGPNYQFTTDVNYNGKKEGTQRAWTGKGTFTSAIDAGALKLSSNSISLKSGSNANNSFGSIFGPEAISSTFEANAGDQLAFSWKAAGGADDYEIYGFLYNVDTQKYTELMYGRGKSQAWTNASGIIPDNGNYRFRFVAGSYDQTGGYALGAALFIDNIRVLNSDVNSVVVEQIARLVQYENAPLPRPLTDSNRNRSIKATLVDSTGLTSDDSMNVKLVASAAVGGPGGVAGAAMWLSGEEATKDGTGLSSWKDKTGNNNFLLENRDKLSLTSGSANFNPAVVFNGGRLVGDGSMAIKEGFAITKHNNLTGEGSVAAPQNTLHWSSLFRGNATNVFSQIIDTNTNVVRTINNGTSLKAANSLNLLSVSAPAGKAWANGTLGGRVDAFNNVGSTPIYVGSRSDGLLRMNGSIAELIVFDKELDELERLRVNSYLALKYGITLKTDAGDSSNYIASDGASKMWTASKNVGYGYRVTGIGRDDNGTLLQKQSKSQEEGALVTVSLGSDVSVSNIDNANGIARNLSFFTFSDDNGSADYNRSISSYEVGNNLKRMERVFKVDKTYWQNTSVTFQLGNVGSTDLTYLVIGSDKEFAVTPPAYIPLDANGKVTVSSVTLSDGEYFTFVRVNKDGLQAKVTAAASLNAGDYTPTSWTAFVASLNNATNVVLPSATATQAEIDAALAALAMLQSVLMPANSVAQPGGVSGATLWVRADQEVTTSPAGNEVTGWADLSYTNAFTVHGTPELEASAANFNPAVKFDNSGVRESVLPVEGIAGDKSIKYADGYVVFTGKGNVIGSVDKMNTYGVGLFASEANRLYAGNGTSGTYYSIPFSASSSEYFLAGYDVSPAGATAVGSLNGNKLSVTANSGANFTAIDFVPMIGGSNGVGSAAGLNWQHFNGSVAEVVLFPTSKSAGDKSKIESYLALKYGITLNNGTTDYISSNGASKMWVAADNAGYGSRITGIGRDDGSALLQKQSKSTHTDAMVTIAVGDRVAASVTKNTYNIDRDLSFFTISDNNASTSFNKTVTEATYYGNNMNLMDRTFKVDKTNWQDGLITLKLDRSINYSLPLEQYYLVISSSDHLSAPQFDHMILVNANGEVTINSSLLADGSYFTFAKTHKDQLYAKNKALIALTLTDYTPETRAVMQDALNTTATVLATPEATQYEIDGALEYLEDARKQLELADAALLKAKIDAISLVLNTPVRNEPDYTVGSWVAFKAALTVAEAVYGSSSPVSTPVQLGQALSKLVEAEAALVNIVPLQNITAIGNPLAAWPYTSVSWIGFPEIRQAANAVLANPNATQVEVDAATAKLTAAVAALVPIDKTALQNRLMDIDGENLVPNHYTTNSWGALLAALDVANAAVTPGSTVSEADVNAALTALSAARAGLVDKSQLQAKHDAIAAEKLLAASYTPGSWSPLQAVLAAGNIVLSNPDATQPDVVAALAAVIAARDALVLVTTGNGGGVYIPTPTATKETITVDVVVGGDNPADITKVDIERTRHTDGRVHDEVTFTREKAQETADKAVLSGRNVARIVIPDTKDEVTELNVNLPVESLNILVNGKIDLEIYTDHGVIQIPYSSLEGLNESLYFRLVPVRDLDERKEVEERARTEEIVRKLAGNSKIVVVDRPMTIETNLKSRPVNLVLPLRSGVLPENAVEREAFLNKLGIFIEHSDGEKVVVVGVPVKQGSGELGLRFGINKFSTFTILNLEGLADNKGEVFHKHYIDGYPDGTFLPERSVTRAEMAALLVKSELASIDSSVQAGYSDLLSDHWSADYINKVSLVGLMSGYPDGTFQLEARITRAEMATIIFNYLKLNVKKDSTAFPDTANHWADGIIAAVQAAGVLSGYPDGTFRPDQALSRAEAVIIINGLLNRGPLFGTPGLSWPDVDESHWAYNHIEEAAKDHSYTVRQEGGEMWLGN